MGYTTFCMENPPRPTPTHTKIKACPLQSLRETYPRWCQIYVFRSLLLVLDAVKRDYGAYSLVFTVWNQGTAQFQLPEGQRTRRPQRRRTVTDLWRPKAGFQCTLSDMWSQENTYRTDFSPGFTDSPDSRVIVEENLVQVITLLFTHLEIYVFILCFFYAKQIL